MMVCHELGKTEEEVSSWAPKDLYRWVAYFRLKAKAERKAMERARRDKGSKPGTTVSYE
jgi:hypothetical protein